MTVHELKTIPPYFEDVAAGRKTFEVRHTYDRTFAVGDVLHLREWTPPDDPEQDGRYTGREVKAKVTYLLRGPGFGIPEDLAVMGIGLVTAPDTSATVPDEAVQATLGLYPAWVNGDDVRDIFAAAAEAGWVPVPGPVHVEWSNTYTDTGERWPRPDEATARGCAADDYPAVAAESRQVTEWRPAESTQDGDQP